LALFLSANFIKMFISLW